MLQFSKKRLILYTLLLLLLSTSLYGCNKEDSQAEENPEATDTAGDNNTDDALQAAVSAALGDGSDATAPNNPDANTNPQDTGTEAPTQKAIAERSPVEITRIEVEDPVEPQATGAGEVPDEDDHNHEPVPNLFPIDECQVEVNGIYKVKLAKDLLKEINSRRSEYGIGAVKQNTSLLACADSRCKEQSYFVGHFRPDGSAFNTVAPPGYIQGECIAVDYRTVNDIMEAWFSVNKSRMQIMNPDYTQCGISIYDIDGTYFIAAEFAY